MSLREKIEKFAPYFKGIEYQGGLIIVKVNYPDKIEPVGSDDELIKVARSEDGFYYYYADADTISEDSIFKLIEETVKVYEEARQKVSLLKAKVEELKTLFASNNLDKLNTLEFVFKPKKKTNSRPRKKNNVKNISTLSEEATLPTEEDKQKE